MDKAIEKLRNDHLAIKHYIQRQDAETLLKKLIPRWFFQGHGPERTNEGLNPNRT